MPGGWGWLVGGGWRELGDGRWVPGGGWRLAVGGWWLVGGGRSDEVNSDQSKMAATDV